MTLFPRIYAVFSVFIQAITSLEIITAPPSSYTKSVKGVFQVEQPGIFRGVFPKSEFELGRASTVIDTRFKVGTPTPETEYKTAEPRPTNPWTIVETGIVVNNFPKQSTFTAKPRDGTKSSPDAAPGYKGWYRPKPPTDKTRRHFPRTKYWNPRPTRRTSVNRGHSKTFVVNSRPSTHRRAARRGRPSVRTSYRHRIIYPNRRFAKRQTNIVFRSKSNDAKRRLRTASPPNPEGDIIVFPEMPRDYYTNRWSMLQKSTTEMTTMPEIPTPHCRQGEEYCDDVDDYPGNLISEFAKNISLEVFDPVQSDFDIKIVSRFKPERKVEFPVCAALSKSIYPKVARNYYQKDKWILNEIEVGRKMFRQRVDVETCVHKGKGSMCSQISEEVGLGFRTECRQKYVQKKLFALDTTNLAKVVIDTFKFPSCCVCYIVGTTFP